MFVKTLFVSALFLAFSCVSLQANTDTLFDVPSNTTGDAALLMAGVRDRARDQDSEEDDGECAAADACYDKCDDEACFEACEAKYPECPDCEEGDDDCD
jgi:hypothetical protein